jgi:hypothetical protein
MGNGLEKLKIHNPQSGRPPAEREGHGKDTIPDWKVVAASVAGVSHEKAGLPCQDAHGFRHVSDAVLIAAVADGAGSAALAEVGARLAIEVSLQTLERRMQTVSGAKAQVGKEDLEEALQAVRLALETEAEKRHEPVRELATTLLLAVVSAEQVAVLQIGDGAVIAVNAQQDLVAVTTPPDAEYANATTFVTSPDALEAAQIVVETIPITALALFSDGLQRLALKLPEGTPHAPFFTPLFGFAAGMEEPAQGAVQLASFLRSPRITERADDDLTLVLAVKR